MKNLTVLYRLKFYYVLSYLYWNIAVQGSKSLIYFYFACLDWFIKNC